MTLQEAIDHVRQNIAEKLSGNTVLTQTAFLSDVFNLYVLPDLVTTHDWSWKYDYVDQALVSGTHTFTPDLSSLGTGVLLDDLYTIVLLTGNLGTVKTIEGRNLKWFLERYPDRTLQPAFRPDYFTVIGAPGDSRFEVWLSQPTDAAYTARLVLLKTYAGVALTDQLPLRADKHLLLVAGATSYAFASLEQMNPSTEQQGGVSPAAWWLQLYRDGMEKWWVQDQAKAHVLTTIGRYEPRVKGRTVADYWKDPFVKSVRGE